MHGERSKGFKGVEKSMKQESKPRERRWGMKAKRGREENDFITQV